jgi:ribosome biogenesis GTPase A
VLSDNPGILWPKLDDEGAAYRLAFAGALPDTAFDFEDVAHHAAAFLLRWYPALLIARYDLATLPSEPMALLEAIGRRRGCIRAGGVIDTHKAADHFIHDFRSGVLGRISLESP